MYILLFYCSNILSYHIIIIGHVSRRDYLALAEKYPEEFERLICSLKLLPYKGR